MSEKDCEFYKDSPYFGQCSLFKAKYSDGSYRTETCNQLPDCHYKQLKALQNQVENKDAWAEVQKQRLSDYLIKFGELNKQIETLQEENKKLLNHILSLTPKIENMNKMLDGTLNKINTNSNNLNVMYSGPDSF